MAQVRPLRRVLATGLAAALVSAFAVDVAGTTSATFIVGGFGACPQDQGASPSQWNAPLGLPVAATGAPLPQTIVIVENNQTPDMTSVTATLQACGIAVPSISIVTDTLVPPTPGTGQEATGDVIVVAAAAPVNASIVVANTGGGLTETAAIAASACGLNVSESQSGAVPTMTTGPSFPAGGCVISSSWGVWEQSVVSAGQLVPDALGASDVLDDLADLGVVTVVAAGDSGSGGCQSATQGSVTGLSPGFPASHPLVVGVGGTQWMSSQLTLQGQNPDLQPGAQASQWVWADAYGESDCQNAPWNNGGGASAGGGGFSAVYQANPAQEPSLAAYPGIDGARMTPDVAAMGGWPFYAVNTGSGWEEWYGTSGAAPSVAAGLANVTAALTAAGQPALDVNGGNDVFSALYGNTGAIADVTQGTNNLMSLTWNGMNAWDALPGYDMASGLGVPDFTTLANTLLGRPAQPPARPARSSRMLGGGGSDGAVTAPVWRTGEASTLRLAGGVKVDRDMPSAPVASPKARGGEVTVATNAWVAPRIVTRPGLKGTMQVKRAGTWVSVARVRADAKGVLALRPMQFANAGNVNVRVVPAHGKPLRVVVGARATSHQ